MQITDAEQRARRFLPFFRILVILATIAVVDVMLGLVFAPPATLSDVAWTDYRTCDDVDCVFVGSSYAQRAFDPTAFDEIMGTSSINIATPGQLVEDTYDTVKHAVVERGVKRVILGVGVQSLTVASDPYARVPYLLARNADNPLAQVVALGQLAIQPEIIGTKDSLNLLMPWTFISAHSVQGILSNVRSRMAGDSAAASAERTVADWHYIGKGYGNYDMRLAETNKDGTTTMSAYGAPTIDADCFSQLEAICALCHEKQVELVVVSTPHPHFDLLSLGDAYPQVMSQLQTLVARYNATYLDFNLVKDSVLKLNEDDFADFEHLNLLGATSFTRALANTLHNKDQGHSISSDFFSYDDWALWVSTHTGQEEGSTQ